MTFLVNKEELQRKKKMSKVTIMDHVDQEVKKQYNFLKEQTERIENMYSDYNDLLEYRQVIEVSRELLQGEEFKEMTGRINSSQRSNREYQDPEEVRSLMRRSLSELEVESQLQDNENSDDEDGVKMGRIVGT